MIWLPIAMLGYGSFALVSILDKFILSKAVPKASVFVFYNCLFLLPLLFLWPFVLLPSTLAEWAMVVISGFCFSLSLWAQYIAVQKSEVSHVGPLIGAVIASFSLLLSVGFLGVQLENKFLFAVIILIIGTFLISFENSKAHNGWHAGMLWGVVSGLLASFYYISAKFVYGEFDFFSGLILIMGSAGLLALPLLFLKSVRMEVFSKKKNVKKESLKNHAWIIIFWNKVLAVVGLVLVQYAVSLGPVALVNSLQGFQYGLLIILVALFSKYKPKLFKEEYTRVEIIQEVLAVLLIAVGLALLV